MTFNANGGAVSGDLTETAVAGQPFYTSYTSATYEGKEFKGWNTQADGSGTTITDGQSWSSSYGTTLYAQWGTSSIDVTFDCGSGTTMITETVGGSYTLPDKPTKTGYDFGGWFTGEDGTGTRVTESTVVKASDPTTLYAKWTAKTYTVTFDANGGTFAGGSSTVTGYPVYDQAFSLDADPVLTGYRVTKWTTGQDGSGISFTEGTAWTLTDVTTLYAQWEAQTYTVTFDANGGTFTGGSTTMTGYPVYGQAFSLDADPTLTGYHLTKWTTGQDGSGTSFAEGTVWTLTEVTILYAQWEADSYTVTFNPNGGDHIDDNTATATYDSVFNFSFTAHRTGYTFQGWWTDATGGSQVKSGDVWKYTDVNTLYAHWTANEYTVTFDPNGGTLDGSGTATATYDSAFYFTTSAALANFDFLGWYTSLDDSGTQVTSGDTWRLADDTTLYAKWLGVAVIVSFDDGDTVTDITEHYGSSYILPDEPERSGYDFGGWFTEREGKGDRITSSMSVATVIGFTVYAYWIPAFSNVTFDAGDGVLVGSDSAVALRDVVFTFTQYATREGYAFAGWWTAEEGGTRVVSGSIWSITGDVTLYARWTPMEYMVTFYANGGGIGDDSVPSATATAVYGEAFYIGISVTRSGYSFAGWFVLSTKEKVESGAVWSIASDTVLYAGWTQTESTVTFDANGGTLVGSTAATATFGKIFEFGQYATLEGYRFMGWYTETDGGEEFVPGSVWRYTGAVTLHAHWEAMTYTVAFDANGGDALEDTAEAVYGSAFVFSVTAHRTGYTQSGWWTAREGGEEVVSGDIWEYTGVTVLYAHWTAVGTCTVTFDANGGTLVGTDTASASYGTIFWFDRYAVRTGYIFSGWNTAADGGGTDVLPGAVWTFDTDTTLYAQWELQWYTVTFDANGGTLEGSTTARAVYGLAFDFDTIALREGYENMGWFTDPEGGEEFVNGDVWNIAADTTLYAHWKGQVSSVTFDANGGAVVGDRVAQAQYGSVFDFDTVAVRTGYTFGGWFTEASGGTEVLSGNVWETVGPVTLYAHWSDAAVSSGLPFGVEGNDHITFFDDDCGARIAVILAAVILALMFSAAFLIARRVRD